MKKNNALFSVVICSAVCFCAIMTGCMADQSIMDDPEITVEHLSGSYAAQLVRDGAVVLLGSIAILDSGDGTVSVEVFEKEIVEDSANPKGFYIADKNLESMYQLAFEADATFLPGGSGIASVMGAGEFIAAVYEDLEEFGVNNPDYNESKLYDIYIMGEEIQLLIARYIP